MMAVITLLASLTTLVINLYTLYTIRLQVGKLGSKAVDEIKNKV